VSRKLVFTEGDLEVLREIVRERRQRGKATPRRPAVPDDPYMTPEVYVALTPADGIPAVIESDDTGTAFGDRDVAGCAFCDVYRLVPYAGNNKKLEKVGDLQKLVHNVFMIDLPGNRFVPVARDKYGDWLATTPALDFGTC